jgi:hypothetical protein
LVPKRILSSACAGASAATNPNKTAAILVICSLCHCRASPDKPLAHD